MKTLFILLLLALPAFPVRATVDASNDYYPGPTPTQSIDGASILVDFEPDSVGNINWTNLNFYAYNDDPINQTYQIGDSTVTYQVGNSSPWPNDSTLNVNNTLTGHVTTLTLNDSNSEGESSVDLTVSQVDNLSLTEHDNGNWEITTYQTSPLAISYWYFGNGSGQYFTLNADSVVSFSFPDNSYAKNGANLTFNGAFNVAGTDSILIGLADGGAVYTTITIGGTSATPDTTGAAAIVTLMGNGCTVTTN